MSRRRNKEETIDMLMKAVGCILREKGYPGIGVNKVADESGVSKPMIYEYFGNLNGLLKAYIQKKDYWLPYFETLERPDLSSPGALRDFYIKILQDQFRYFHKEKEMQKLILWQVSEFNQLMRSISESREKEGRKLLALADEHFRGSGISLKAVIAILVGGIYFIVLHDSAGSGSVSGIDIANENEYELMISTVAQIVEWAFNAAENKKNDYFTT